MKELLLRGALWFAVLMGPQLGHGATLSVQPVAPTAQVSRNAVRIEWPSHQGVRYQIEQSATLADDSWSPLSNHDGTPLTRLGTGGTVWIEVSPIEQSSRFFRVRPVGQTALRRRSNSPSLIAHWPFDSITNCETPELIQPILTSLTPNCEQDGPVLTEGVLDQALEFDGVDDHALAAPSPTLAQLSTFTTTAWIRIAPSSGWRPIIDHRDAGSDGWDLYLDPSSHLFIRVNNKTSAGSSVLPTNEWAFVAASFDGSHARLYLNGELDSIEAFSTTPLSIQSALKIGEHFELSSLHFSGTLDDLRVYDQALSDAEILIAYQQSNPIPPSYPLTVNGGTGSGDYVAGEQVAIAAALPAPREAFDQWTGDTTTIQDLAQPMTLLTMPDQATAITATYRERISDLQDALVAHWKFNENHACTTVDEITGQSDHLSPDCANANAPQWAFGLEASGLLFDATDDQVLIQNRPDLAQWQALTLSAWVKPSAGSEGWRPIGDLRDADADGFDLYLDPSSRPFLRINQHTLAGHLNAPAEEWSHLVGSFDGSILRVYLNGTLVGTKTVAPTSIHVASALSLGRHYQRTDMALDGTLEEVRLYHRALTDTEISLLYSLHEFAVPETAVLTVDLGTGSGEYLANAIVPIAAEPASLGYQFSHWEGDIATVADPHSSETSVTIGTTDLSITAHYAPLPPEYYLDVTHGSGDGLYPAGTLVPIEAKDRSKEGLQFASWSGETSSLLAAASNPNNSLTMPAASTTLQAVYEDNPSTFAVRIENGMRGTGVYAPGTTISLMAANAPHGLQFAGWSGSPEDLALLQEPDRYWTSLITPLPGRDVDLIATYELDPLYSNNPKGYQPRPNSLDLDGDGELGESGNVPGETDDLIPGGVPSDFDFANMTHDVDGDGIDEDLIYVDAERGDDANGTGTPANPYRTLRHALAQCDGSDAASGNGEDIVLFHGTFYAVELDEAFRRIDIQDRLIIPHGGEPGGYKLRPEHDTEVPTNPFRLIGWDYDGDGVYPPMDPDDVSVLHGNGYRGERAISNQDGAHSYWELAHFTIEEYAGDPHPESGESAPNLSRGGIHLGRSGVGQISHIYIHDLEMRNILNNWETPFVPGGAEGHGITFFSGAATLHHITVDNLFVNGFAGFFGRGAPGVGSNPSGPYRFENMTLKNLRSTQRPGTTGQAIATGFKIWNWTRDVTLKDCIFDAQADLWHDYSNYHPTGYLIRPGMQNVRIVGNEFYDMHTATGAVGDLTTDPGAAQDNIVIDGNRFIVTFDQWTVTTQPQAKRSFYLGRGDDNTFKTTGDFRIVNNMFYLDGGANMVAVWLDGGNAIGPQEGQIVVAGNTFYGPGEANQNAYAIRSIGSRAFRYEDYVIKNNVFLNWGNDVGGGSGGKHIFFGDQPASVVADGNVFAPESGFGWGDRRLANLPDWQQELGQDTNSSVGVPELVQLSPGNPQQIDLHVAPTDTLLSGSGVNISDWTPTDFDGHPRTGVGPFWAGADVRDQWDTRPLFDLLLTDGTGGGRYPAQTIATIQAKPAGYGREFSHWEGDTDSLATSATLPQAEVLMPEASVSLTAVTVPAPTYTLTVHSGTGSGDYFIAHDQAFITADADVPQQVFSHWDGDIEYVADPNARSTSITVPHGTNLQNVTVTARYISAPTVSLAVQNGFGTGHYGIGESVTIGALTPAPGQSFFWWEGDTEHLIESTRAALNQLVMPGTSVSLSAYIDRNATTCQFVELTPNTAGEFLWHQSQNWHNGYVPRIVDIVEIGNDGTPPFTATLQGEAYCRTLEIAEGPRTTSGSRLKLQSGSLTVDTVLNVGKDLGGHVEMFAGTLTLNHGAFKVGAHWPSEDASTAIIHGGTVHILDARLEVGGDAAHRASSVGSRFELRGGTLYTHDGIRVNSKRAAQPGVLRVQGTASLSMERFAVEIFNGRFEVDGSEADIQLANLHFEGSQQAQDAGTGQILVEQGPATLAFSGASPSTLHVAGNVVFGSDATVEVDQLDSNLPTGTYVLIDGNQIINAGVALALGTDSLVWTLEVDAPNGDLLLHKHAP